MLAKQNLCEKGAEIADFPKSEICGIYSRASCLHHIKKHSLIACCSQIYRLIAEAKRGFHYKQVYHVIYQFTASGNKEY